MSSKASKKEPKTGVTADYLHGFSSTEQDRLYQQARLFEPSVYKNIDFSGAKKIVEVGCGVGAQTQILLERFPNLKVSGVDASESQIKRAQQEILKSPHKDRASFQVADALHLPFEENSFDGAFICWFLEHVQGPVEILNEVRRVLKPEATIICNETFNATFYLHPYSPATQKYWFEFNDHQWNLKGDPFVGGKLANYLLLAGYQNIETRVLTQHYDNRTPKKRANFVEFWASLLLSGAPALIKAGKITPKLVEEMADELDRLKNDPDAVIFYSWIQAQAKAL